MAAVHPFSSKFYNELPEVETTNILYKELPMSFQQRAGDCLKKYGMHDSVGLTLLHNHFKVNDGKILVERFDEMKNSFETGEEDIEDWENTNVHPAMFCLEQNRNDSIANWTTLEYSDDPAVEKNF